VPEAAPVETPATEGAAMPAPDTAAVRMELLRSAPETVDRFMLLMVPVLVDVYAASVIPSVRIKTLTAVLKAVSFLDDEALRRVLKVGGRP
jgi:E3 ubiquitin-protein ligase TRIP12